MEHACRVAFSLPYPGFATSCIVLIVLGSACTAKKHSSSEFFIVGGSPVTPEMPAAKNSVGLLHSRSYGHCSASILSSRFLLTAAHCVVFLDQALRPLTAEFGLPGETRTRRKILRSRTHEEFSSRNMGSFREILADEPVNDISVLYFEGGLPEGAQPVTLPSERVSAETDILVVGTGASSPMEPFRGNLILRFVGLKILEVRPAVSEFSAGDRDPRRDSCVGDSGGPVFLADGLTQVGLTSRGSLLCDGYGVYTDVTGHLAWLNRVMEEDPLAWERLH